MKLSRRVLLRAALIAGSLALTAVAAEGFLAAILHSRRLGLIFPKTAASFYFKFRNSIGNNPDCAQYDPELRLTLKAGGACRFSNEEFDTVIRVNALGLRDSDEALRAPDVIVLGDSYAMGWGVNSEETFAKLLERRSGLRVLNAGIAGYDTVSELLMLRRLDASRLKYLIIQYCLNDYEYNKDFDRTGVYAVESQAAYEREVEGYSNSRNYHPGQYLSYFLRTGGKMGIPSFFNASPASHVKYFLNALLRVPHADLSRIQLIVISLPPAGDGDLSSRFISELKKEAAFDRYPPYIKRMRAIDVSSVMGPEALFRLDDHITTYGHDEVAGAILPALGR